LCNALRGLWGEATKRWRASALRKLFKEGRESGKGDESSGRPRSHRNDEDVEKVRNLVHLDRRLTIRPMYLQINLDKKNYMSRKRPELWPNDWILQNGNAPTHKALSVKQFLVQKSITELE